MPINDSATNRPHFFAGLDTSHHVPLEIGSDLYIHGWLFAFETEIDAVYVSCNGTRYPAVFPVKRPQVADAEGAWIDSSAVFPQRPVAGDLNPDVDTPYDFGFVSAPIPVDAKDGQSIDINLIAVAGGREYVVQSAKIELLWSDPTVDFFALGAIAPFKCPADFDKSRLLTYDDCSPAFLVGTRAAVQRVLDVADNHGIKASDATLFAQMFDAIVACYDVYCEFHLLYFKPLESQSNQYAFSKFDIYGALNALIAWFHVQLLELHCTSRVHALVDDNDVDLIPLLNAIYPRSIFVHIDGQADANNAATTVAQQTFSAKIRVLRDGNSGIEFRDVRLGAPGDTIADRRTAGQIVDLLRLPRHTQSGQVGLASSPAGSGEKATAQCYLQALPRYRQHRPIFILGTGRSGTSAMTGALKTVGIAGFQEGHVFPLMKAMARRVWKLESLRAANGSSQSDLPGQAVCVLVKTCFEQIYGAWENCVWLDKTPDHLMIDCVPFLREMFPLAKFLFMRRHPIAVAESRKRKFGSQPFFSIPEWKECMTCWDKHKRLLAGSSYLECDANKLRSSSLHNQLSDFLGLDRQSGKSLSDYLALQTPQMTRYTALNSHHAYRAGLEDRRKADFDTLVLSLLETLDAHIEDTDWDAGTAAWVCRYLGTLPAQFGYAIHRPKDLLSDTVISLAMQIDQYRRAAACNGAAIAVWREKHAKQLAMVNHWREQYTLQTAIGTQINSQAPGNPPANRQTNSSSRISKIVSGILNRINYI